MRVVTSLLRAALLDKRIDNTVDDFGFAMIGEDGLDGVWLHRVLKAGGFESCVVDPASIEVLRAPSVRTECIDGEIFLRTLVVHMHGGPRT